VEITWGELHVGSRSIFAAAGFTEVSRPTARRVVKRIDFQYGCPRFSCRIQWMLEAAWASAATAPGAGA
jgi:hypothetical protein